MTIYSNRANFEIAKNHEKQITLQGVWYRYNQMEYWVMTNDPHGSPACRTRGFTQFNEALDYFESLLD